ncbi:hypothetical protein BDV98DRAFT_651162 [Pterulicium gracile]|uniref:NTF2-like protein n=1 Tax=Pterulicium gracile TaxID=1884261 RepID=A0A5C3Q8L2_9AGAR|nr:hypothetical protein BDV98DRAFT_651162 [Pterula gracilis]
MPLPNAQPIMLSQNTYIQPPLSRRGTGPALIVILPSEDSYTLIEKDAKKPLDPDPAYKWAEEGYAVLAYTTVNANSAHVDEAWTLEKVLGEGLDKVLKLKEVDGEEKVGLIVYDPKTAEAISKTTLPEQIKFVVSYGAEFVPSGSLPTLSHVPAGVDTTKSPKGGKVHTYTLTSATECTSPSSAWSFTLPLSTAYHPPSSSLSHTRSLTFIKPIQGGPYFDIEAVWEEHTKYEFETRDVEKTMGTMVREPYVNHVPTMTGGMGREKLTEFYTNHFIPVNPDDTALVPISRTIGVDRIIDEFIFTCTHTRPMPWFLPGVPPTNKKLAVPFVGVVNVRGDRLYHEHIWWDQATALRQAGLLAEFVDWPGDPSPEGKKQKLRLPVAGVECARLLADEMDGESNVMFESGEYGLRDV